VLCQGACPQDQRTDSKYGKPQKTKDSCDDLVVGIDGSHLKKNKPEVNASERIIKPLATYKRALQWVTGAATRTSIWNISP
jgi:hypothetical protein